MIRASPPIIPTMVNVTPTAALFAKKALPLEALDVGAATTVNVLPLRVTRIPLDVGEVEEKRVVDAPLVDLAGVVEVGGLWYRWL